jgi:hypothetical protein
MFTVLEHNVPVLTTGQLSCEIQWHARGDVFQHFIIDSKLLGTVLHATVKYSVPEIH